MTPSLWKGVGLSTFGEALFSTVHGAGRIMTRTAAKGNYIKAGGSESVKMDSLVHEDDEMDGGQEKSSSRGRS